MDARAFVRRHSVAAFFVATFALSWGVWLPVSMAPPWLTRVTIPLWGAGMLGPGVAGLLLAWVERGRVGPIDVLRRFTRWRADVRWYAFAVLFPAVTVAVVAVDVSLRGVPPLTQLSLLRTPAASVVVLLLVGPVSAEIGWRGYALPRIQRVHGAFNASLVIGVAGGVWRLPLLWVYGDAGFGVPIAWALLAAVSLSVLFTWLFNRTRGSLLATGLFHAMLTATGWLVPTVVPVPPDSRAFALSTVVAAVTALLAAFGPDGVDGH